MTLLENLKKEILEALSSLNYLDKEEAINGLVNFDVAFIDESNSNFGDVSSNICLVLAKKIGKTPKEIGVEILKEINLQIENKKAFSKILKKVELAENSFLNFFLKDEFLISQLERSVKLDFIDTKFTDQKVLVEHSSPNLFKPFHIGHFMNNTIGQAVVSMLKISKADLRVVFFPSDISLGVAKAIYILKNKKNWSFFNEDIIQTLGDAYVEGVKFYEENQDKQEEIKLIAKNLFERNTESEDYQIFAKAREVNIEYLKKIIEILGTKFDHLIYESEAGIRGEEIVKENLNKDSREEVFKYGENGAIIFDTKRLKNKDSQETIKSVFINSEGHPTYEAKDLGLLDLKVGYFGFDYNFFITDLEQAPHFEVVLEATKELGGQLKAAAEKSRHIPHGRLNLKGSRMSSRLGNVLSVEEILDLLYKKARERLGDKTKDLNEIQKEDLIKNVSLAAFRVIILKSKPGLNIDFDLEAALSFEGNTGPYLLYTYARANSLLGKVGGNKNLKIKTLSENSTILIKKIIQYEDVLKRSIEEIAPQAIIKYLFELAQSFNTFYAKEKILGSEREKEESSLAVVADFMQVFKKSLNAIGITEVESM